MKTQVIQLDEHDDILSARDKIGWSQAARILLIWPDGSEALSRRVDLALLQRHSWNLGARLALVTRQRQIKHHARQLGIPVFQSLHMAQKLPWRGAPRRRLEPAPPGERRAELYRLRERFLATLPQKRPALLFRWLPFFCGLLSALALAVFLLPSATIRLSPAEEPQEITLEVSASPAILAARPSGEIPAEIVVVVVEGRAQAVSTGRTLLPAGAATAVVRFANLTGGEVTLPAGTVVATLDEPPVRFETSMGATVPAGVDAQPTEIPVRAILAGSSGNVAAGEIRAIEGNLGLNLTVSNPEPAQGGTDQSSPSPSEGDYLRLREQLLAELENDALAQAQALLEKDQQLLPASLQVRSVLQETRQPEAGQPGEQLKLTLRVEYTAWYAAEQDVRRVVETVLNASMPAGFREAPGSLAIQRLGEERQEDDAVRWQVHGARRIYREWKQEDIAAVAAGRAPAQVGPALQQHISLRAAPEIQIRPAWWPRLPFLPLRIQVGAP